MVTSRSAIHKPSNLAFRNCSTIFGAGYHFLVTKWESVVIGETIAIAFSSAVKAGAASW